MTDNSQHSSADAVSGSGSSAPGRALVTFSRGWQSLAAVRSLGARGVEVVTGDEYELTPGSLSRFSTAHFTYPDPARDREGFLDALEEAVHEHRPPDDRPYVLMPVHRETYVIAQERERFEPHIRLTLPPSALLEQVRDKGRLVELAREAGIAVPETWAPRTAAELREAAPAIPLPAIVKVRRGAAGVGLEKVDTRERLEEVFEQMVEAFGLEEGSLPIVQALAPGDDYCVTALCEQGRVRAMMTYRNVSKVVEGAPGAVRETVAAPPAEAAAEELLTHLGWHGIAQLDFMWDGSSESTAYLIEINPRFFGGLYQAIASGIDYPWLLYRMSVDGTAPEPDEVELGVRTEAPVVGLLATLREIAESATDMEGLGAAWDSAREQLGEGDLTGGLKRLWRGLSEELDAEARVARVRAILEENEDNVSQLLESDDLRAGLGLVYPLAVFLRHGKVTTDLLVGATPGVGDGEEGDEG